jgi:hypothetical protein
MAKVKRAREETTGRGDGIIDQGATGVGSPTRKTPSETNRLAARIEWEPDNHDRQEGLEQRNSIRVVRYM